MFWNYFPFTRFSGYYIFNINGIDCNKVKVKQILKINKWINKNIELFLSFLVNVVKKYIHSFKLSICQYKVQKI